MKFSKKTLAALAIAGAMVFGVGAGYGTYAYFVSTVTSENNTITAGDILINASGTIMSGLAVTGIYPGAPLGTSEVTVKNDGSLKMKYKLTNITQPAGEDSPLHGELQVRILNEQGTKVFSQGAWFDVEDELGWTSMNEVADMNMGEIDALQSEIIKIQYRLPTTAGNDCNGATGNFIFNFDATQADNPGWAQ